MNSDITRIAIVEDNEVVKDGFSLLIGSMEKYTVVGAYTTCEQALRELPAQKPHVILMDIELPGMTGIEGTRKLKKIMPGVDIIVITVHEDSDLVFDALCAGASGYITKNSDYMQMLEAIKEVRTGGSPMSSKIARMVVNSFQKNTNSPLTARETEVLELLAKGKSYSVIAEEIFVHKETVKSHIKNIYHKLQVSSKAEAIEKAIKNRLI